MTVLAIILAMLATAVALGFRLRHQRRTCSRRVG